MRATALPCVFCLGPMSLNTFKQALACGQLVRARRVEKALDTLGLSEGSCP